MFNKNMKNNGNQTQPWITTISTFIINTLYYMCTLWLAQVKINIEYRGWLVQRNVLIDEPHFYLWLFMHTHIVSPNMYTINQNNLTAALSPFTSSSSVLPPGATNLNLSLSLSTLLFPLVYLPHIRTYTQTILSNYSPISVILHTQPIFCQVL